MKAFVDWSWKKGYEIVYRKTDGTISTEHQESLNLPDECKEVYAEPGQKFLLYNLIQSGKKVFLCSTKATAKLRKERNIKKRTKESDKVDAMLIYESYRKDPTSFQELKKPDEETIRFQYKLSKYAQISTVLTALKNRKKAFEKQYGKSGELEESIKLLEKEKKTLLKECKPLIKEEYEKTKDIRGIDVGLLARLLAHAHPNKAVTLSRYLSWTGYKGHVLKRNQKGEGKRPNYKAKSDLYLMAKSVIMHGNEDFRPRYDQCKERYRKEHPDWTKRHVDNKALNIIATFIAKEFWKRLHEIRKE